MGKKRTKDKSPREDEEIDLTGPNCRHIKKGTDQTLLKKLAGSSDWTSCQECKPEENKENSESNQPQEPEQESETAAVWMCLKCGHRGCGRHSENQHAIKHYETPRSDPHCLVLSMDNWSVWCYICDDEVQYSRTGHLSQLVTSLQKQSSAEPIKRPQKRVKEEEVLMEVQPQTVTVTVMESEDTENKDNKQHQKKNTKKESVVKKSSPTEERGGVSVKGLSNLGNTCFFNAVIQSLSQTLLLRQTLNKVAEEKMSVDIKPGASSDLEPVTVQLAQPGSLTLAMCGLLNEIQESKKGVVTPQELFTQVCKRAPRFKGFQQQDSQELLRYLLDGMRAEEHKRVSTGIVEALKQSKKSTDEEQLKTRVKEYEKNGFPQNLVDRVFGGELTSTIMCQQCKTVSVVTEMFLDLSLPILDEAYKKKNLKKAFQKTSESSPEERISPALTNGDDDTDVTSGGASKYQQKKAKKQAKKQAKQQKRQQKFEGRVTLDHLTSPSCSESDQMDPSPSADEGETVDTETHKEEEGEGEAAPQSEGDAAQVPAADVGAQDQDTVQAEKVKEEEEEGEDSETDSSANSSASNRFTVLSKNQDSKDGVLGDGNTSDVEPEAEEDTQLVSEMEKVTLDEAFIEDSDAADQSTEVEDEPEDEREYTVVNQDPELAFHTLASRTSPEKMDCSVESCLFQFTEVETLTENNSLLCVTCTKQRGIKDKAGGSKKNVYTDALKQMLISSPPPVLTLHMKRFKQSGHSISKVNRHVPFPLILDLASFCVVKCKNVTEGETQILYSLYGIVEHSGTMRSGHYTGYVKVRPECPKSTSNGHTLDAGDAEPAKGSWFHISDTSVQPASESKVQSCQAYLLFYERIV